MNQPADPRDALARSLAEQLTGMLGVTATATRLVNAPPLPGKHCVVALFSYPDGTSGAAVQLDVPLTCQIGTLLTGEKAPPIAQIEADGFIPPSMRDAISEFCNVLAGLFNATLKRRIKLTGVALLPLGSDLSEVGGIHLPCLIGIPKMSGGRLDLRGKAIEEIAAAAKAQAEETSGIDFEKLGVVITDVLSGFCGRTIKAQTGTLLVIKPDLRLSIGEYAPHGGKTSMLIVTELSLSAYLGAAPVFIPRSAALEQIKNNKLEGTLYDGLHEVYNVLSAPYARRHIRLCGLHWQPGNIPQSVRALMPNNARLPAFTIDVDGYGTGKMALVGDCKL